MAEDTTYAMVSPGGHLWVLGVKEDKEGVGVEQVRAAFIEWTAEAVDGWLMRVVGRTKQGETLQVLLPLSGYMEIVEDHETRAFFRMEHLPEFQTYI